MRNFSFYMFVIVTLFLLVFEKEIRCTMHNAKACAEISNNGAK